MKFLIPIFVATALMTGCVTTPVVYTDFDPAADFAQYRTYRWAQKPEGFSPLQQMRVVAAVDAKLRERGWTQSTTPQVELVGRVVTETRYRVDSYDYGPMWGGWGWGGWGGCCWGPGWGAWGSFNTTTTVRGYTYGTLTLDMYEAQTQRPLWRGIAMGTVPDSPVAQTTRMQDGIDRMFAQFPPVVGAPAP